MHQAECRQAWVRTSGCGEARGSAVLPAITGCGLGRAHRAVVADGAEAAAGHQEVGTHTVPQGGARVVGVQVPENTEIDRRHSPLGVFLFGQQATGD